MFLNQGKFRQNGGCGYVLKPKVMRTPFKTGKKNGWQLVAMDHVCMRTCLYKLQLSVVTCNMKSRFNNVHCCPPYCI